MDNFLGDLGIKFKSGLVHVLLAVGKPFFYKMSQELNQYIDDYLFVLGTPLKIHFAYVRDRTLNLELEASQSMNSGWKAETSALTLVTDDRIALKLGKRAINEMVNTLIKPDGDLIRSYTSEPIDLGTYMQVPLGSLNIHKADISVDREQTYLMDKSRDGTNNIKVGLNLNDAKVEGVGHEVTVDSAYTNRIVAKATLGASNDLLTLVLNDT